MAEPGSVGWQFSRKGIIQVGKEVSEDDIMVVALDHGAEDIVDEGDSWRVTCESASVFDLKSALEAGGIAVQSATSTMVSSMSVPVTDAAVAKSILRIMDDLEENDDIQDVYSNFDMSDDLLSEAAS
jgi:transcriptional/translational regulatory protein YebC/TACO1